MSRPGDTAYVDVSVATAWVAPDTDRPVDAQAVGDPVDVQGVAAGRRRRGVRQSGRHPGADVVETAKQFVGLPYLWAGISAFGFDCSGFTHTVYAVHGVEIPRDAGPQSEVGTPVAEENLRPGDLVFFGEDRIHHVGIYAGDGYVIDAPSNSETEESLLEYVPLKEHRYYWEYAGARRILPDEAGRPTARTRAP